MRKREREASPSSDSDSLKEVDLSDLSDEQREAYRFAVEEGRSVFITGGAGTGKSFLLRKIIAGLRKTHRASTFVTATTGVAALNIGGSTLHGFAGCGVVSPTTTIEKIKNTVRKPNWKQCRTLVIDEVSMMDAHFFSLLDDIARHVRRGQYKEPFGGIQLILSGDFLQLPPVSRGNAGPKNDAGMYCFLSPKWLLLNPILCMLSKPFRQKETEFFDLLNEMRLDRLSQDSVDTLVRLSTSSNVNFVSTKEGPDGGDIFVNEKGELQSDRLDGYTCLRPRNKDVDAVNTMQYNKLKTTEYGYTTHHTIGRPSATGVPFSVPLFLREGCRVMLIKNVNVSLGLVNGSVGVVKKFISYQNDGYVIKNYPNHLRDICKGEGEDRGRSHTMLPVVTFSDCEVVVEPQMWEETLGDRVVSRYSQMPLVLAYGITIHKAQGMSLNKVDIDFSGTFEAGQAYVALSRCTNLHTVKLHNFTPDIAFQDEVALAYYRAAEACNVVCRDCFDGKIDTFPSLNKEIESLRLRIPELDRMAIEVRNRVRRSALPIREVKDCKVVLDLASLQEISVRGGSRSDALLEQDNLIRVPLTVVQLLQDIHDATTREEEMEVEASAEASLPSSTTASESAIENTVSKMMHFIEKGKQALVLDSQRIHNGVLETCESFPPPLSEWGPYRELLPLVFEVRDDCLYHLNLLGCEDPRERLMYGDVIKYALWLKVKFGGNVVVCTGSVELAAQALALGLSVTSLHH